MKSIILFTLTVLVFSSVAGAANRRIDMSFEGQMASAVEELKEKMKADPDIDGRKLRVGRFRTPDIPL